MKTLRCVGLDVHKDSIAIAVADPEGGEPSLVGTIPNDTRLLLKQLRRLGKGAKVRCCYEAGPTGYGLHRDLNAAGVPCVVVAPSLVPKQVVPVSEARRHRCIRSGWAGLPSYSTIVELTSSPETR